MPHALHVYAPPALLIYEGLVHERAALLLLVQELRAREAAPHAEVHGDIDLDLDLDLPQLHPNPGPNPNP